jgi:hypothetical protein
VGTITRQVPKTHIRLRESLVENQEENDATLDSSPSGSCKYRYQPESKEPVMKEVIHNPLGISTLTPSEPGVSLMAESWANYHVQSLPCLVPGRDVYQRTKRECDPLGSSDAQSSKRLAIHPGDK